jgi:hypothetical protein
MYPCGDRRQRARAVGDELAEWVDSGKPVMRRQPDDLFSSIEFLREVLLFCTRMGIQFKFGQAISAVQPGPAEIVRRKVCNLMIAATMLKPRPRPLVFRVLSER